ncbi:MAG: B12-binding domain-containing radical SAM protein [Pleomorphochaeta sp.]
MNILLISTAIEKSNLSFPLGALCIESAIKNDKELNSIINVKTNLYDLEDNPIQIARELANKDLYAIGLSIYLWNRDWFDSFTKELEALNRNIIIFAGGSEISANATSFDLNLYRFLVSGEGEETTIIALKKLINDEPLIHKGILSKENPTYSLSDNVNLDSLSSPFLTQVCDPFLDENCSILWEMTRGCPFKCGFCFESKGLRTVRNYPFERIEAELDYIVSKGIKDIFVLDPTFNIDKKRTLKILNLIKYKAPDIHFTFEIRAELIDEDIANAFSEIFCSLQIGLQSIHSDVLKTVNRNFKLDLFKEKISILEKLNLVYGLDLIIGLPNDNLTKFKESLDFTVFCKPSNIDIFLLSLLPGTKIYDEIDKYQIKYNKESPYTLIQNPSFTLDDIEIALKIKKGCDLFYTKGEAVMFMKVISDAFDIKPSDIFESFIDFLENNYSEEEIEIIDIFELQDAFIRDSLPKHGVLYLEKALLSYIEMHQGLAYYLEVGESPILSLYYAPNKLSDLDDNNIKDFVKTNKPFKKPKNYYIVGEYGNIDIIEY